MANDKKVGREFLDGELEEFNDEEESKAGRDEANVSGGRHYMTVAGERKLRAEFDQLFRVERPKLVETIAWAASNGDRSENADYIYGKRRLREIDRRIHFLTKRLESAIVVNPSEINSETVVFGARVTLVDEDEVTVCYQLVGEDEADPALSKINWLSPLAQALMGKRVGDEAIVQRPAGEKIYTIQKIEF